MRAGSEVTDMRGPIFGNKEFFRGLIAIGLPIALQNLLTNSLSLVDSLMVGQLGEGAIAAVGVAGQFSQLMFGFYWGICCGGTTFFAQYFGAGDERGIRRSYGLTLSLVLLIGFVFSLMALCFPQTVMAMYTSEADVQALGVRYMRIVGLSYMFTTFSMALSCLLRSLEQVRLPLIASVASLTVNTLLNYMLITGNLGAPALGVEGAAIASCVAAVMNFAVLLLVSIRQKNIAVTNLKQMFEWPREFLMDYARKCSPIVLNETLYGLALMVVNIVIGRQGEANIAAMTIFRTIEGLIYAFFRGLSSACTTMVGKHVGAGELDVAIDYTRWYARFTPLVAFVMTALVLTINRPLLGLFDVSDGVKQTVVYMLMIYAVMAPFRYCDYVEVYAFRAGGESRMGMYFEVGGIWLITVPLTALCGLVLHLPFVWVFFATFVEEVVKLPIETHYMHSLRWIKPVTPEGRAALDALRLKRTATAKA